MQRNGNVVILTTFSSLFAPEVLNEHIHWNGNVVILMKFAARVALKVVKMKTFSATNDENFIQVAAFPFHGDNHQSIRVSHGPGSETLVLVGWYRFSGPDKKKTVTLDINCEFESWEHILYFHWEDTHWEDTYCLKSFQIISSIWTRIRWVPWLKYPYNHRWKSTCFVHRALLSFFTPESCSQLWIWYCGPCISFQKDTGSWIFRDHYQTKRQKYTTLLDSLT